MMSRIREDYHAMDRFVIREKEQLRRVLSPSNHHILGMNTISLSPCVCFPVLLFATKEINVLRSSISKNDNVSSERASNDLRGGAAVGGKQNFNRA